jgi:hypothetical protein
MTDVHDGVVAEEEIDGIPLKRPSLLKRFWRWLLGREEPAPAGPVTMEGLLADPLGVLSREIAEAHARDPDEARVLLGQALTLIQQQPPRPPHQAEQIAAALQRSSMRKAALREALNPNERNLQ